MLRRLSPQGSRRINLHAGRSDKLGQAYGAIRTKELVLTRFFTFRVPLSAESGRFIQQKFYLRRSHLLRRPRARDPIPSIRAPGDV